MPLVVAKETATPGMRALDESTRVAVKVAAVALSVKIKFVDEPNATTPETGTGVVVAVLGTLSLQAASAADKKSNAKNLVNFVFKKWSRT